MQGEHFNHAAGPQHYRWSDDRLMSSHGYVKLRVGTEHPLADSNGYAYEHLLVWVSAGNPRPSLGQILRHKNEAKADNRYDNLYLTTRSALNAERNKNTGRNAAGQFNQSKENVYEQEETSRR